MSVQRAAAVVVRVIRRIADSGRTVVCTIHQPSAELFYMFDDLILMQRGGRMVYVGPLGQRGCKIVEHLHSIPGTPVRPRGMNVASWMLDVLQNGGAPGGAADGVQADDGKGSIGPPAPGAEAEARSAPLNRGFDYLSYLLASPAWAAAQATIAQYSSPAPGSSPLSFSSTYARGLGVQLAVVLRRTYVSYWRDITLNYSRLQALLMLSLLLGTIYYRVDTSGVAGVQSVMAFVFMVSNQYANQSMNPAIPMLFRERAVYYRESSSRLYRGGVWAVSVILAEVPYIAAVIFAAYPIPYFMAGLQVPASFYFFALLVTWLYATVLASLGMLAAALFPAQQPAQMALGLVSPLLIIFSGLYIPTNALPTGLAWASVVNPLHYVVGAIVPSLFHCTGADCPTVTRITPTGPLVQSVADYIQEQYGVTYADRWPSVAYLVVFIAVLQALHALCVRFISHVKR
jgi:ABC-type multidrug transport system permease subunit